MPKLIRRIILNNNSFSLNYVSSVIKLTIIVLMILIELSIKVNCGPTLQQEQELLLLDALGRRYSNNPVNSNYSPNSIMDILGKSKII